MAKAKGKGKAEGFTTRWISEAEGYILTHPDNTSFRVHDLDHVPGSLAETGYEADEWDNGEG